MKQCMQCWKLSKASSTQPLFLRWAFFFNFRMGLCFEILNVSFFQHAVRVTGWPGWVVPRHAVRGRERQSSPRRLLLVSTQYLYKLTPRPTFLSWHFSVLYNPLELVPNNLFPNMHWKIMRCSGLCESNETWSSTYLYQHTHLWVEHTS